MADDHRGRGELDRQARALWRGGHTEPDTRGAREICIAWPTATCTVLAIAPVTRTASEACAGHPRIAVVACDLQTADPGGALGSAQADVVVLSHLFKPATGVEPALRTVDA